MRKCPTVSLSRFPSLLSSLSLLLIYQCAIYNAGRYETRVFTVIISFVNVTLNKFIHTGFFIQPTARVTVSLSFALCPLLFYTFFIRGTYVTSLPPVSRNKLLNKRRVKNVCYPDGFSDINSCADRPYSFRTFHTFLSLPPPSLPSSRLGILS